MVTNGMAYLRYPFSWPDEYDVHGSVGMIPVDISARANSLLACMRWRVSVQLAERNVRGSMGRICAA